jgi:hypothetical protein
MACATLGSRVLQRYRGQVASFRAFAYEATSIVYKQGQLNAKQRREYFYYVDHNGYGDLDDARMKNFTSAYKGP